MNATTQDGKCRNCGRLAVLHSTGECSWCTPKETLEAETDGHRPPLLAENAKDAVRMAVGGRRIVALKEGKTFDAERLQAAPLFAQTGRLF